MNRLLTYLIVLIVAAGCGDSERNCSCEELIDYDGLLHLHYISDDGSPQKEDQPYTGMCTDTFKSVMYIIEKNINVGIVNYSKEQTSFSDSFKTIFYHTEKFNDGKMIKKQGYINGQLLHEKHWQDSLRHGSSKVWLSNGQKWGEGIYVNGKLDGITKRWYPNGNLRREGQFKSGHPNGLWKYWYDNGDAMCETNFTDGNIISQTTFPSSNSDSLFIEHYPDGDINWATFHNNGKYHGLSTKWHENGVKSSERSYVNGEIQGEFICWNSLPRDFYIKFLGYGDTTWIEQYVDGKVVSQRVPKN